MPNISEIIGQILTVSGAPPQSHRDSAIAQLKDFTRQFNDGNCPSEQVIDDFMRNFDSTELLGPVLRGLSEEKKEEILRAAARCHVGSFGRGREFLAKSNQLHLVDQDCAALLGALSAEVRAKMIDRAYVGPRGQIVLPVPDIGLHIPLGRTSLGTGEGALTTHEVRGLLMYQEDGCHWLLEIFSAKLAHFDEQTPDTETCHVWSDLIDRYIDRRPIAEFSEVKAVLEALAFTLMTLTDRVCTHGDTEEFPIRRMLVNSAQAYFLVGDHMHCGAALLRLAKFYSAKRNAAEGADAAKLAASVLARDALALWKDGRTSRAVASQQMALCAYAGEAELRGVRRLHVPATTGAGDEPVPLPALVEHISRSDFEAAWARQLSRAEEIHSQLLSNIRSLLGERRLERSRAAPPDATRRSE
ncbi:hypothetical protein [Pandoraea oxalativorans]|uniref:Uncharacterized protein n=1 Tax=Pandoraea oxalativorans TaxID=573737 RepID=A0A0E3YC35_9BURK|nr:hypothetical protein [Pandoraea oxalativorans]AKC69511.1 hypothetical protein MB84_08515 [Pandoraea oxalativorans]